ncbi:hypothetical protein H6P81_002253 [Aristolochia fimbriata]|uniref:Uncharacterized protein n=1 Tax=Aristolochia fimbriata TaxID=158543 RepID=A0AAV7F9A1_ARIFI|nr:hypothetical protein H6P81_002253 [Aristolochia fimbriata]
MHGDAVQPPSTSPKAPSTLFNLPSGLEGPVPVLTMPTDVSRSNRSWDRERQIKKEGEDCDDGRVMEKRTRKMMKAKMNSLCDHSGGEKQRTGTCKERKEFKFQRGKKGRKGLR